MADLPIPSNARYVGQCIYCGKVGGNLTKEHAIPYGLNGPWTLLSASCDRCAGITSRFEQDTLRNFLLPIRTVLTMQTRRKKKRPAAMPLGLESEGKEWTISVPPEEFPL